MLKLLFPDCRRIVESFLQCGFFEPNSYLVFFENLLLPLVIKRPNNTYGDVWWVN